ncbi:Ricin-type beta-trefoil lectin domain-like [Nannocystis exedens]|uniref:Ricin-type beta-trefoil lectin domain-like n=2 Tax=Nannocystis exedens TaxID=54 RepID=A0A1I1Y9U5_9BACT|nr:Endo-1,4-beta-xylanase A precursor [Nannocystis exedens]SFE16331.1 Ricin-type beta-trefoil lectin domain-like [Nannocystis exedens]
MPRSSTLASMAAALLALGPAVALADTTIQAKHSGKVLDIEGASSAPGARVSQYTRHNGPNQLFALHQISAGVYTIVARHSGQCLDVDGASMADSVEVGQYPCHGGAHQQFMIARLSDGSYLIIARHSGKCLDIAGAGLDNGARLHQFRCHGGDNQRFYLDGVSAPALPEDLGPDDLAAE